MTTFNFTQLNGQLVVVGKLPIGVAWNGVLHRQFILRPQSIADNLAAVAEVDAHVEGDDSGAMQVAADQMKVGAHMACAQIISLGGLEKEHLTYAFISQHLDPADYDYLCEAGAALKKKRAELPEFEQTSGESV